MGSHSNIVFDPICLQSICRVVVVVVIAVAVSIIDMLLQLWMIVSHLQCIVSVLHGGLIGSRSKDVEGIEIVYGIGVE